MKANAPTARNPEFLMAPNLRFTSKLFREPLFRNRVVWLGACSFLIGLLCSPVVAQQKAQPKKNPKIVITNLVVPAGTPIVATGNAVYLEFSVKDPEITFVKFKITTDVGDAGGFLARVSSTKSDYARYVPLFKGTNSIELYAVKGDATEKTAAAKLPVICNDPRCYSALPPTAPEVSPGEGGEVSSRNVTIARPAGGESVTDVLTIERAIAVQKASGIKRLAVDVTNGDKIVEHKLVPVEDFNDTLSYAKPALKLAPGKNVIRVYNLETLGEKANQDSVEVTLTCTDQKCGKGADTAGDSGGKKGDLTILQPTEGYSANNAIDAYLSVAKQSKINKIQYEVFYKEGDKNKRDSGEVVDVPPHADKAVTVIQRVKLHSGENTIRFFDSDNPGNTDNQAAIKVTCTGDKCLKIGTKAAEEVADRIKIDEPTIEEGKQSYQVNNISSIDSWVTVPKGKITKIQYDVITAGRPIWTSPPQPVDASVKDAKIPIRLRFMKGPNTIRIYDADHPGGDNDASIVIDCLGENCASDLDIATINTNSRFTRVIVGIEQAGASSADSKSNPFLDFFFTTPLLFDRPKTEWESVPVAIIGPDGNPLRKPNGELETVMVRKPKANQNLTPSPRFGAWSQVRFSATPQQTSAFAVFPSNFVNQVSDPTKVIDLVQSFDFLAGLEYRAFNSKGWIWTLIPGVRQRSSVYLTFGAGAISPLTAKRESAQIFTVPAAAVPAMGMTPAVPAHPLRAEFVERFGDPGDKIYVGFVPLERDRFFRQYYLGFRIKTHYCDDPECITYKNRFPSIVDISFGQNEAVTGGRLTAEIRDPGTDIIKRRRAWVGRVDAFFPLPFREANFLYLYGTAIMKLGGGKVRIQNALFLDSPGTMIQITDPRIYTPPPDLQPTRIDRDYYKIGIGVNLTDLFNRNKPKE